MIQTKRSNRALSLDVFVMYYRNSETSNHVFLHCEVASNMWNYYYYFFFENWVSPGDLGAFLSIKFRGFGRERKIELYGNVQCLQFYGVFGWRETHSFQYIFFGIRLVVWLHYGFLRVVSSKGCLLWISKGIEKLYCFRFWVFSLL